MKTVGISDAVWGRLEDYLDSQPLPPPIASIVSLAVERFLDEAESENFWEEK